MRDGKEAVYSTGAWCLLFRGEKTPTAKYVAGTYARSSSYISMQHESLAVRDCGPLRDVYIIDVLPRCSDAISPSRILERSSSADQVLWRNIDCRAATLGIFRASRFPLLCIVIRSVYSSITMVRG